MKCFRLEVDKPSLLALAGRKGLGGNTFVKGLGDLGSGLPAAFDEAFISYRADFCADWKHISDYVGVARKVLWGLDAESWAKQLKDAIWDREPDTRDKLSAKAHKHRLKDLPTDLDNKCPCPCLSSPVIPSPMPRPLTTSLWPPAHAPRPVAHVRGASGASGERL